MEEFANKLNDEGFMRKTRVELTMLGGKDIVFPYHIQPSFHK